MPSRAAHLLSRTIECISVARLASVSIMNSACSATDGEFAVPATISGTLRLLSAGTSTASKPTPIRVTTLHVAGSLELGLAEAGAAERHAVDRRVLAKLGLEIPGRNHVGELDHFDVVAFAEKHPAGLRERLR